MSNSDESLEQLLSKAAPRPVPDDAATAAVREVVRDEWRVVSGQRRRRKTWLSLAAAATILIAVFSITSTFRVSEVELIRVAEIQRSFGAVFIVGEQSVLIPVDDLKTIHAGQTIRTDRNAGIALAWANGGSVRFDANTTVEFRGENSIYLHDGKVYFDSTPSELIAEVDGAGIGDFEIETRQGRVTHVGTQFMTEVDSKNEKLLVSVREGRVAVAGRYHPYTAVRGEQVVFSGRQPPLVLNDPGYGENWSWVARISPAINTDGKSAYHFLHWAGRELGRKIEFSDEAVERMARTDFMMGMGRLEKGPVEALRLREATTKLEWRYKEGTIYVSNGE